MGFLSFPLGSLLSSFYLAKPSISPACGILTSGLHDLFYLLLQIVLDKVNHLVLYTRRSFFHLPIYSVGWIGNALPRFLGLWFSY